MKKLLYIITPIIFVVGFLFISSCDKLFPFNFSDENNVDSVVIRQLQTKGIVINRKAVIESTVQDSLNGEYGLITFTILNGSQYLPLVMSLDVYVSNKATIRNWPDEMMLAFKNTADMKSFYVASESGKTKKWIIRIVDQTPTPPDPNKQNTTIQSFTFPPIEQGNIKIVPEDVNIGSDSIIISYESDATTNLTYPITINPIVKLPSGAYLKDVVQELSLTFTTSADVKQFTVVAADNTAEKTWYVALQQQVLAGGSSAAEIIEFKWLSILPSSMKTSSGLKGLIYNNGRTVYIPVYTAWEEGKVVKVTMENLSISDKATMVDYTGVFSFTDFNDVKTLRITAENGKMKTWQIKLLYSPQFANSGFEEWSTGDFPYLNGGQWSVNNNQPPMVSSVVMVEPSSDAFQGKKSAELSTRCITRGAAGVNSTTPISGGTIFIGGFNFSASEGAIRNPSSMYNYGKPFEYAPTYMKVALKYKPASPVYIGNLQGFSNVFGNAVPNFKPTVLEGMLDSCDIWIKVYDSNNNVIGEGQFSTGTAFEEWKELYIPVIYTSENMPAKVAINCSSSKKALQYIGASGGTSGNTKGSTLMVDDLELMYLPTDFGLPILPQ